jgi:Beta-lactamase
MYALGSVTGKNYTELLKEYLTTSFNMTNTFPSPGSDLQGVIPNTPSSWGADYKDNAPTGGLVSTISDLSIFLHSILTYTILDTRTAVRQWLQPHSYLGSLYSSFGMPWEIFRLPPEAIFPQGLGHIVNMFKKDGIAVGYRSRIAILDEYGAGFVILAAGDSRSMGAISNALLTTLVPTIDKVARDQVNERGYTGTFANNCGDVSFNATVSMDDKGLTLSALVHNNTDIILSLKEVYASTLSAANPSFQINPDSMPRLYPAGISTRSMVGGRMVTREDWRLIWDDTLEVVSDLPGQGITPFDCRSWETVDLVYFGHEPVDRVVFVKDIEGGEVLGLDVPFLRSNGTKSSACWIDVDHLTRSAKS